MINLPRSNAKWNNLPELTAGRTLFGIFRNPDNQVKWRKKVISLQFGSQLYKSRNRAQEVIIRHFLEHQNADYILSFVVRSGVCVTSVCFMSVEVFCLPGSCIAASCLVTARLIAHLYTCSRCGGGVWRVDVCRTVHLAGWIRSEGKSVYIRARETYWAQIPCASCNRLRILAG